VKHLDRAKELLRQAEERKVEGTWLQLLEDADTIFPFGEMDYRVFCR
jgi:hypothetical protein